MICRVCDSTNLEPVLDLGQQPWCNHFLTKQEVGKEPFYSLRLMYCNECSTSQLDYTVPKEIMFGNHTYLSGITKSLSGHFRSIAEEVTQRFLPKGTKGHVLDIGSNDGTQLKHFLDFGWDVTGVESSVRTADIAKASGVNTINAFFNEALVDKHNLSVDAVNAAGVFFHLEELHSVTKGIKKALKQKGVFVVQFLYMKNIIENCAFDQIYHEHLLYYTLKTINRLLGRHGLEMFDAYVSPIHGGSVIGFIGHPKAYETTQRYKDLVAEEERSQVNSIDTFKKFAKRVEEMKAENLKYLKQKKAEGKTVYGMGAPVKGNTMLNYFGVNSDYIQYLVEKNALRKNTFAPGSHIEVILEDEIKTPPDVYYVLAWNFKKEILANNQKLIEQGVEFYFPVDPDRSQKQKSVATTSEARA